MKILYLTTPDEDYLQDQVLIGLRTLFGADCVDFPKKDVLYSNCLTPSTQLYGNGFTVWKTLEDIEIERQDSLDELLDTVNIFDVIVFGSVWRQQGYLDRIRNIQIGNSTKLVFLDGEDHAKLKFSTLYSGRYYKREIRHSFQHLLVNKIGFSIPACKLINEPSRKMKNFATHVQCDEAYKIDEIRQLCKKKYAFTDESRYYEDIARSRYAVTMKKGGWECMRHYEIAANATVPCFYRLSSKPAHCAPHGLIDMHNVVAFDSADELTRKIGKIEKEGTYHQMMENALDWARQNTCDRLAERIIAGL